MRKERNVTNYDSMHKKLKRVRGKAKDFLCVDCQEKQAIHWSLNHDADFTTLRIQETGREVGRVFSVDVYAYSPRCMKCHAAHDMEHGLLRAPNGVKHTVKSNCTASGCERPHHALGLCDMHYSRLKRERTKNVRKAEHNPEEASHAERPLGEE